MAMHLNISFQQLSEAGILRQAGSIYSWHVSLSPAGPGSVGLAGGIAEDGLGED